MASGSGPYFIDPELGQSSAPDAQIYALAGGALQAHQEQHQLAGLVQAATAAADHDEQGGLQSAHDPDLEAPVTSTTTRRGTRKRRRGAQDDGDGGNGEADSEGVGGGDGDEQQDEADKNGAAGTGSGSALFRRPSKTAKKYTRPPMSKLFSSLELSPESFLQLQSAAKGYMLDPAHTERQDTVGQRGKGDSELVKLRLWNCVKDFLENRGIGVQYFGASVPGDEGQPRTMVWPRDKNSIIGAVTPLLRRMVTNERQRQYAVETRRSGAGVAPTKGDLAALLGDPTAGAQLAADGPRGLFELTTGASPAEYVVGETYDWPMLQPHLVMVIPQMGLAEDDVKQVVACISYHLRYTHREGFMLHRTVCSGSCPWDFIDRMVNTGRLDKGTWDQPAATSQLEKRMHMKPLLKEVFDIMQNVISAGAARDGTSSIEGAGMTRAIAAAPKDGAQGDGRGPAGSVLLQVSLLQDGARIMPRRDIEAHITPYLHSLVQDVVSWVGPVSLGPAKVKVLSPEGLVAVEDDAAWQRMLRLARVTEWMDKEMKVVVEFA